MRYFNYHAVAKQLIADGKLISRYYAQAYKRISPALVLLFNDDKHPVMPIRRQRWDEYEELINEAEKLYSKLNTEQKKECLKNKTHLEEKKKDG